PKSNYCTRLTHSGRRSVTGGHTGCAMSALGQKQTCAVQDGMSALPSIATVKADIRKWSCLLYPATADMCAANHHVCFGPIADIATSRQTNKLGRSFPFDHTFFCVAGFGAPFQEAQRVRITYRPICAQQQTFGANDFDEGAEYSWVVKTGVVIDVLEIL